jgi:hypothetical protein
MLHISMIFDSQTKRQRKIKLTLAAARTRDAAAVAHAHGVVDAAADVGPSRGSTPRRRRVKHTITTEELTSPRLALAQVLKSQVTR